MNAVTFIGLAVMITGATITVCQEIRHARRVLSAQILGMHGRTREAEARAAGARDAMLSG